MYFRAKAHSKPPTAYPSGRGQLNGTQNLNSSLQYEQLRPTIKGSSFVSPKKQLQSEIEEYIFYDRMGDSLKTEIDQIRAKRRGVAKNSMHNYIGKLFGFLWFDLLQKWL